jgi:hypothetical protein
MTGERFIAAMLAMTSEADPLRHRSVVETAHYRLITVLVRDQEQAVEVCQDLVNKECVESFLLCPGFTNKGVGRIAEAVGENVSVNVARGDGPSNAIARKAMERAGLI